MKVNKERLFEHAFFHAPIGMALVSLDGYCIKANPALCRIMGYSEEELQHLRFQDFTHPDDVKYDQEYLDRVFSGEIVNIQSEKRYIHKEGHIVWILLNLSLITDERGNPSYFIAQVQDLTEKKCLLDILSEDKQRYRIITENTLDMISEQDIDGTYVYVSESCRSLLGYEPYELIGRNSYDFFHRDDMELIEQNHKTALTFNNAKTIAYRFRKKDGSYIWFETACKALCDKVGHVKGILSFSRDISFRKESEKLLIQSEKLSIAGQLAAGIAHEIRNPLTSLKGFLQLIGKGDHKQYYFDIMNSELNRIELILSELLVLSKPQVQTSQTKDLIKLLVDVCTLLETQAIMKNVQIATVFPSHSLYIQCDENKMKQAFINFIKNAIESMPAGGELFIEVEQSAEKITVRITDQGTGIPEEKIPFLGQPFYSTKENGTGLGLMVSYKIIEELKGRIFVSSKINEGTTFQIELPLHE
ncbi:PAS domain S-box protein [Fodinisporobacter ferrooxydans]|uniref:histidine kinase n=1 Tax=Fodinisporobacter ferrooxydans TaxID=2901836 RepID=A0ABY4CED4_9BACL|nr:PAS domain S-box protein [Alicyclobacillaceae bacterium MYW30-H2]